MIDEIARLSPYVTTHLMYASIVWLSAWLLTSMRRGSATTKYWIWVVTAVNFILPVSAVPDRLWPSRLSWFTPQSVIENVGPRVSFSARAIAALWLVWFLGALLMFARLCFRIVAENRNAVHCEVKPNFVKSGIPVVFANRPTPAVDGVLRPQIVLPKGIDQLLSERELSAVLIHELRHAKRRDNLIRLIHEVSLCALWFHPLVWITRSRLTLYRELSCDEAVTERAGADDLVSALAKLANSDDALLLQATASSFISVRLAQLAAAERQQPGANMMLASVFCSVLLAGMIGPAAQSAAISMCVAAHSPHRGAHVRNIHGEIAGGVRGNVRSGIN